MHHESMAPLSLGLGRLAAHRLEAIERTCRSFPNSRLLASSVIASLARFSAKRTS